MPDPVSLTYVAGDVTGGTWLEWGDHFDNITDLVDQAIKASSGTCVKHLIIVAHGAVGQHGFVGFDNETTGLECIDGASKLAPYTDTVKQQFERLKGHLCPDAVIEFRVCEFGTGDAGANACRWVADWTGATVTAPTSTVKSVMFFGGLSTDWRTTHPTASMIPTTVTFWRGEKAAEVPPGKPDEVAPVTGQYVPLKDLPPPTSLTPPDTLPKQPGSRTPMYVAGGIAAGLVLVSAGYIATAGHGAPAATPSPSPSASPTAPPPPIGPIVATFQRPVTSYDLQNATGIPPLDITWQKFGSPCGSFLANGDQARWSHPDASLGGNCPDEAVHPAEIQVTVKLPGWSCEVLYFEGSAAGTGSPGRCTPAG